MADTEILIKKKEEEKIKCFYKSIIFISGDSPQK